MSESFMAVENSVMVDAYYKGNSTSKLLFELILRLKILLFENSAILHLWHIAGTNMIEQGTNGSSRGVSTQGVLGGE